MTLTKQILNEALKNKDKKVVFHYEKDENLKLQSQTLSLENTPHFNSLLNENMSKEDLALVLKREWRGSLANLGSFVDLYQHVVTTKNYTPYIISQTSKRLNQIFNSQKTVERVINLAVKVGLLSVAFDKASYTKGLAKEYYYNKEVEKVIKKLVDKYDINIKNTVKNRIHSIIGSQTQKDDKGYKVKFSSKLRIGNMTENEALDILYEKYPTLAKYQQIANDMNEDLPMEQQISYEPTFTKTEKGYISKIGIRATSGICSLKVHENENKEYTGKWRDEYLDEYFGKNSWYEFDVKSSVPRVAYLLKTGKWEDMSLDFYQKIYYEFENEDERLAAKNFFMKFYFDNAGSLYNHNKDYFPEAIKTYGKEAVKEALKKASKKVEDVLGESKDSEIFFHESNIYLLFVKWLRDQGIKVVQIYDGFFSNVDISKYEGKLRDIAEEYYREYNNNNDNNNKDNNIHSIIGSQTRNIEINYDEISKLADLALNIGAVNINIYKDKGEKTNEKNKQTSKCKSYKSND